MIAFLPLVAPKAPPIGPHILLANLLKEGFTASVKDCNLDLFRRLEFRAVFTNEGIAFDGGTKKGFPEYEKKYRGRLIPIYEQWADDLLSLRPKVIGLSLFSSQSLFFAKDLMEILQARQHQIRIIIGGPFAQSLLASKEKRKFLGHNYDIVAGEAELSLIEYLRGNMDYPGINSPPQQIRDLDQFPFPKYLQEDFAEYDKITGHHGIYLTGSRGCVRRCTFCDVTTLWPKFRHRSAKNIFEEIKYLHTSFERTHFKFTDSLINGNLKSLRQLAKLLCEYQERQNIELFWGGHFICRGNREISEEDFDLFYRSGCRWLNIGIESGSESVRSHMRKNFSNTDIFYTMDNLKRVGISATILMIIGYINETDQDFQQTLDMISEFKKRGYFSEEGRESSTISSVSWGSTLKILPHTPLFEIAKTEFKIDPLIGNWKYGQNNQLVRIERLFSALEHMISLGLKAYTQSELGIRYQVLWEKYVKLIGEKRVQSLHRFPLLEIEYYKNG